MLYYEIEKYYSVPEISVIFSNFTEITYRKKYSCSTAAGLKHRKTENEKRRMKNGERKTENGEWRMENGKGRIEKQTTDFPAEAGGATDYADYTAVARKKAMNLHRFRKTITNGSLSNIQREAATNKHECTRI